MNHNRLLFAALADDHAHGGAVQPVDPADLVFQIALVGEVEQARVIAEADEGRGRGACLCHIVDFQAAALVCGGLHPGGGFGEYGVKLSGRDTAVILLINLYNQLKQAGKPAARSAPK